MGVRIVKARCLVEVFVERIRRDCRLVEDVLERIVRCAPFELRALVAPSVSLLVARWVGFGLRTSCFRAA